MEPTVRALVERDTLGLTLRAGQAAADRRISWVHASELLDPTPFLNGGELLLSAGLTLPEESDALAAYVERIAAAGIAGLGFGIQLGHERIPPALIDAAEKAGLPILEVPHRTPFIELSKTISQWLTDEATAEAQRAERARQALTRTALRADGLAGLATQVAKHLGVWTLFLDATGTPAAAEPASAADKLALIEPSLEQLRNARAPASSAFNTENQHIAMQSLGGNGQPSGFLVVGRAAAFNATDHHITHVAAALLSVALAPADPGSDRRVRAVGLRLLLEGRLELFTELGFSLPEDPLVVLACSGQTDNLLHDPRLFAGELDREIIAIASAKQRTPSARHIGISAPTTPEQIGTACQQARRALHESVRTGKAVITFTQIGLGIIDQLSDSVTEQALTPLLECDQRGDLTTSLHTWLRHHGQWEPAAAQLGIHRHTLRNRIQKIETLLGCSLDSPDVRAELWLTLRARDGMSI